MVAGSFFKYSLETFPQEEDPALAPSLFLRFLKSSEAYSSLRGNHPWNVPSLYITSELLVPHFLHPL